MLGLHIEQPQVAHNNRNKKMDILFFNSIKKARKSYIYRLILHIVKLILLCVFLPIDVSVLKTQSTVLIAFMSIGIAIVVINGLITLAIITTAYANKRDNNQFFLSLAAKLDHVAPHEQLTEFDLTDLDNCVSKTLYNKSSNTDNNSEGLTPQIRSKYESIYSNIIEGETLYQYECIALLEKNGKFLSFCIVIFGIIALSIQSPSPQQIGVLVPYIVLEALNIWITIVIILLVALSPLIICFFCVVCCCCLKDVGHLDVPESVAATTKIIEQTDGSCSICFQAFVPNQQVTILRCSEKHVFHTGCLSNWLRISHTCPLCRKNVNDMQVAS